MITIWLFEKKGFVSVVAYDPAKDREKESPFKKRVKQAGTHLLVRSRIKADFDSLKEVVPSLEVVEDPGADYAYRCVVTRKQYKKYLSKIVDELDYDSHFKEACRDAAPPVAGRYSALMSTWSIWAALQDVRPYSGAYSGGYGGGYYGGGAYDTYDDWYATRYDSKSKSTAGSKSKPYTSPFGSDANKAKAKTKHGVKFEDLPAYRRGESDPHGLAVDDTVTGYFGEGVVKKVEVREDLPDVVTVSYKSASNVAMTGRFLSTFLHKGIYEPPDLEDETEGSEEPDIVVEAGNLINKHQYGFEDDQKDLDWAYAYLLVNPDFPKLVKDGDLTDTFDDDAWELVCQLDALPDDAWSDGKVPQEVLTRLYQEIKWESADHFAKRMMIANGEVPDRYMDEAIALLDEAQANKD